MNLKIGIFATLIGLLCVNAESYYEKLKRIHKIKKDNDRIDSNWMMYLPNRKLYLNQYNIQGTHDSGTYNMPFYDKKFLQTQSMTIMNQLKSGIRYLDIRITIDMDDKNKLFLSHEGYVCNNLYGDKLYLYDVIETCVEFLKIHKKETIILHLKNESNDYKEMEKRINKEDSCNYIIGKLIADVLNENKDFKNYIYISNEIPKLNDVEKKIVIVSRSPFTYGDGIPTPFSDGIYFSGKYTLGIYIPVFSLHDCFNYNKKGNKDDVNCHPTIYENFHFQDAYNLNCYEKWILVHDDLTNNVNYKIFAKYNKKGDPVFNDLEYNNDICT